jgi:HKD family nuclease
VLTPIEDVTCGGARLGGSELFNNIEWNARHSNEENRRDAIRHAFSKTKRQDTDNSESFACAEISGGKRPQTVARAISYFATAAES